LRSVDFYVYRYPTASHVYHVFLYDGIHPDGWLIYRYREHAGMGTGHIGLEPGELPGGRDADDHPQRKRLAGHPSPPWRHALFRRRTECLGNMELSQNR